MGGNGSSGCSGRDQRCSEEKEDIIISLHDRRHHHLPPPDPSLTIPPVSPWKSGGCQPTVAADYVYLSNPQPSLPPPPFPVDNIERDTNLASPRPATTGQTLPDGLRGRAGINHYLHGGENNL